MIYFFQAEGVGHIKIGFTDGTDASFRLADLQTGSPVPLRLLGTMPGTADDEKNLHRRFAAHRVHGEWFLPVPDLLALICPKPDQVACEGITVVEQTVSVRVLTVGRKQFTKRFLDQLPLQEVFDWDGAMQEANGLGIGYIWSEDMAYFVNGSVWGWVQGEWHGVRDLHGVILAHLDICRWLVWVCDGRLFRCRDYTNSITVARRLRLDNVTDVLERVNQLRLRMPGFRPEDQLFIGV